MKKILQLFLLGLSAMLWGMPATEAYGQVDASASADLVSAYRWRGSTVSEAASLQPSLELKSGPLTVGVWASAAVEDRQTHAAVDELDLSATYQLMEGAYDLSAGLIVYTFPNQSRFAFADHTSPEVFLSAGLPVWASPTVTVYHDFNLGDGLYADLAVDHAFDVLRQGARIGGALGYDAGQYDAEPGFSHVAVHAATDVAISAIIVTPSLHVERSFRRTTVLDSKASSYHLVLGVSLRI